MGSTTSNILSFPIPFYAPDGRRVGWLEADGYFVKYVSHLKHHFHRDRAWCLEAEHFEALITYGARGVRLIVKDRGEAVLESSLRDWLDHATPRTGLWAGQVALDDCHWRSMGSREARQLGLDMETNS